MKIEDIFVELVHLIGFVSKTSTWKNILFKRKVLVSNRSFFTMENSEKGGEYIVKIEFCISKLKRFLLSIFDRN